MGLKGEDAQIYVTDSGDSTSMTGEAMSDTGDGVTYQIDDASKNIFDWGVTFTVSDNNGTVATSDYTLRYESGVVVFDSAPANPVTIDGSYFPKFTVAKGFESEMSLNPNLLEVTRFGDTATRTIKGLQGVEASFGSYEVLEQNIDSGGDDDGPSLDDVVLDESGVDPYLVFRLSQNDSASNMFTAIVQFSEQSSDASSGSAQSRSYSMEVDEQDSAMASQPAANLDILTV